MPPPHVDACLRVAVCRFLSAEEMEHQMRETTGQELQRLRHHIRLHYAYYAERMPCRASLLQYVGPLASCPCVSHGCGCLCVPGVVFLAAVGK